MNEQGRSKFSIKLAFTSLLIFLVLQPFKLNAESFCKTNSSGDENCIVVNGSNGKYSLQVSWTYQKPRTNVVPGKSVKYSTWVGEIFCSSRRGNVLYIVVKDTKMRTISMNTNQQFKMTIGLNSNAIPQMVAALCA